MFSIVPDFNMSEINAYIEQESKAFLDGLLADWRRAGKKHVEAIRNNIKIPGDSGNKSTFDNHTWNLRSSIGYIIIYDGEIIEDYFPVLNGGSEGAEAGKAWAQEVGVYVNEGEGIQMIIIAGMEYAVFVQSKGYDVIDFVSETQLPKILMEEMN